MNNKEKIDILQRALEYIIDAQGAAEAKYDNVYYNDDELMQELEVLITEINCWVIELCFQEETGNG